MSRKGNCWDNAVAESFFHTLKGELVNHENFKNREEAKQKIFQYIEAYYKALSHLFWLDIVIYKMSYFRHTKPLGLQNC